MKTRKRKKVVDALIGNLNWDTEVLGVCFGNYDPTDKACQIDGIQEECEIETICRKGIVLVKRERKLVSTVRIFS
jgi:hypothetical protein